MCSILLVTGMTKYGLKCLPSAGMSDNIHLYSSAPIELILSKVFAPISACYQHACPLPLPTPPLSNPNQNILPSEDRSGINISATAELRSCKVPAPLTVFLLKLPMAFRALSFWSVSVSLPSDPITAEYDR